MRSFVVVHPNPVYTSEVEFGGVVASRYDQLFEKIADETRLRLSKGEKGYLLLDGFTHRALHPFMEQLRLIPDGPYEEQFLYLKERMLGEGAETASIMGVQYSVCVNCVYHLLTGDKGTDPHEGFDFSGIATRLVRRGFFRDLEGFKKLASEPLEVKIEESFTDKSFIPLV